MSGEEFRKVGRGVTPGKVAAFAAVGGIGYWMGSSRSAYYNHYYRYPAPGSWNQYPPEWQYQAPPQWSYQRSPPAPQQWNRPPVNNQVAAVTGQNGPQ